MNPKQKIKKLEASKDYFRGKYNFWDMCNSCGKNRTDVEEKADGLLWCNECWKQSKY